MTCQKYQPANCWKDSLGVRNKQLQSIPQADVHSGVNFRKLRLRFLVVFSLLLGGKSRPAVQQFANTLYSWLRHFHREIVKHCLILHAISSLSSGGPLSIPLREWVQAQSSIMPGTKRVPIHELPTASLRTPSEE